MRLFNRLFQFLVCALVGGLFRSEFFERRLGLLVGLNQGFLAPGKLTLHVVQCHLGIQFRFLKLARLVRRAILSYSFRCWSGFIII